MDNRSPGSNICAVFLLGTKSRNQIAIGHRGDLLGQHNLSLGESGPTFSQIEQRTNNCRKRASQKIKANHLYTREKTLPEGISHVQDKVSAHRGQTSQRI